MIEYKVYNKKLIKTWDEFVLQSINGTIFQLQKFISYHKDRIFLDHSLMFYKNNKLIAVFPAAEVNGALVSHPGASFGGIIYKDKSLSDIIEIIELIEMYAKKNNLKNISIIPTPTIYSNDQLLPYALKWKKYLEKENYYSSIIPITDNLENQLSMIAKNNSRSINFYNSLIEKEKLLINWSNNFEHFYSLLVQNKKRFNGKPTHSLSDIIKLNDLLPEKIKLLTITKDKVIIGGSLLFLANQSMGMIFYNATNYEHVNSHASTIQIIELIKWAKDNKLCYLDFGVSHETENKNPLTPKISLIRYKEKFDCLGS